jgi:hypothetical protein
LYAGAGAERGQYPYWINTNYEGRSDNVLVCFVGGFAVQRFDSLTDGHSSLLLLFL